MSDNGKRLNNGLSVKKNAFVNEALKEIKQRGTFSGTRIVKKIYKVKDSNSASSIAASNLKDQNIRQIIEKALEVNNIQVHDLIAELAPIAKAPINPTRITPELKVKTITELLRLTNAYPTNSKSELSLKKEVTTYSFDKAKQELTKLNEENTLLLKEIEGS